MQQLGGWAERCDKNGIDGSMEDVWSSESWQLKVCRFLVTLSDVESEGGLLVRDC